MKFDDEHTLYAILRSTVKHSLGQFNVVPALDFDQDQNLDTPYDFKNKSVIQPQVTVDASFNPFAEPVKKTAHTPSPSRTYQSKANKGWDSLYVGMESKMGGSEAFKSISFESEAITGSIFENEKEVQETVATTFQIRRKYIVTSIKSGMVVIDQSRAHQRVLYEKFLKNSTVKDAVSQQLLFPLTLAFSKAEINTLNEIKDVLLSIGFIFEDIKDDSITVTGIPLLVTESEVGMILDQLISDYQQEINGESFSQSDILSKTLAKTLAVKTGEVLDNQSQIALVNDLFACTDATLSPFNKPVYITITENDIDKKFI